MAWLPLMTVKTEGGIITGDRDPTAPIRVYSDRWVEDDIAKRFTGRQRRQRLTRSEFNQWRRWAREHAKEGRL